MYPRTDDLLTVSDVIAGWVRSGPVRADPQEALTHLVQAFWGDELRLFQPAGAKTTDRLAFLKGLHGLDDLSEIVFVESEAEVPPDTTLCPNGEVIVDFSLYVVLPKEPSGWGVGAIEQAYEKLSKATASAYPPGFLTIFRCHRISRQDFGRYCDQRGWPRPAFWFKSQPSSPAVTTSRDQTRCRQWLRQLGASPKKYAKDEYFDQAKTQFPTLSRKAFDKLWAEFMPEEWSKAGRPRGRFQ